MEPTMVVIGCIVSAVSGAVMLFAALDVWSIRDKGKKPNRDIENFYCKSCGKFLAMKNSSYKPQYCPECGTKVDWGE